MLRRRAILEMCRYKYNFQLRLANCSKMPVEAKYKDYNFLSDGVSPSPFGFPPPPPSPPPPHPISATTEIIATKASRFIYPPLGGISVTSYCIYIIAFEGRKFNRFWGKGSFKIPSRERMGGVIDFQNPAPTSGGVLFYRSQLLPGSYPPLGLRSEL